MAPMYVIFAVLAAGWSDPGLGSREVREPALRDGEPSWWVAARRAYVRVPRVIADGYEPPPVLQDRPGYWNGVADEILLRKIQTARILRVTVNRGGSSVSLRLHMEGGVSAAFKPDQIYRQSIPRKEIAAYVINKLLGFARVPPATYRVVPVRELMAKLECARWRRRWVRRSILPDEHGNVAGEVSYWIPRLAHLPLDSPRARHRWYQWLKAYKKLPRRHYRTAAQLSVLLIFDFLINNMDRMSGWNVCGTPDGRMLWFMDNTMSFFPQAKGSATARNWLERVQRFSRKLVRNLARLTASRLRAELAAYEGAPWPILTDREIEMVMRRRDYVLRYVFRIVARFGWERTMVFP